jgi:hypothetical protein
MVTRAPRYPGRLLQPATNHCDPDRARSAGNHALRLRSMESRLDRLDRFRFGRHRHVFPVF